MWQFNINPRVQVEKCWSVVSGLHIGRGQCMRMKQVMLRKPAMNTGMIEWTFVSDDRELRIVVVRCQV